MNMAKLSGLRLYLWRWVIDRPMELIFMLRTLRLRTCYRFVSSWQCVVIMVWLYNNMMLTLHSLMVFWKKMCIFIRLKVLTCYKSSFEIKSKLVRTQTRCFNMVQDDFKCFLNRCFVAWIRVYLFAKMTISHGST